MPARGSFCTIRNISMVRTFASVNEAWRELRNTRKSDRGGTLPKCTQSTATTPTSPAYLPAVRTEDSGLPPDREQTFSSPLRTSHFRGGSSCSTNSLGGGSNFIAWRIGRLTCLESFVIGTSSQSPQSMERIFSGPIPGRRHTKPLILPRREECVTYFWKSTLI